MASSHATRPVAALLQVTICLILSTSAALHVKASSTMEQEIDAAVGEMQGSGYFSFAMLVNMVRDSMHGNVTFLMPSDRALSEAPPAENGVLEFLSRHSIPSPLRLEELKRLPDGTVIPTRQQGYMVNLAGGSGSGERRRSLCLNGVELVRANLCVAGSSVRCHGISGVLFGVSTVPERSNNKTISSWCSSTAPGPAGTDSPGWWSSPDSSSRCGRPAGIASTLLTYGQLLATMTLFILLVP